MRVMQINFSDSSGGAARSTLRLHQGLQRIGVDSTMLVLMKTTSDPTVVSLRGLGADFMRRKAWDVNRLPTRPYRNRDRHASWSVNWLPYTCHWSHIDADLVHLHWIGAGTVPVPSWPTFRRPVVWTLKDSWAFTGGCHIPHECRHYEDRCGHCPLLGSSRAVDLSRLSWHLKARALSKMKPVIVTPSTWLANSARRSNLLKNARIEVIPNPLDLELFSPAAKEVSRATLGLPLHKKLVAFGAFNAELDLNKGYDLLKEALTKVDSTYEVVLFGVSERPSGMTQETHPLGTIRDDSRLAMLFSAVDALLMPSRSENLPNTIIESLACGTPVVAFRVGGIPELIEHRENGYLAEPFDTTDLARGIAWVLEDVERHAQLRASSRAKAEREYELTHIARRYQALYNDVLSEAPPR